MIEEREMIECLEMLLHEARCGKLKFMFLHCQIENTYRSSFHSMGGSKMPKNILLIENWLNLLKNKCLEQFPDHEG